MAMTEGGCPAEQWTMKAYQVYKGLQRGEEVEPEVCCTPDAA
ncbi:MAG: hypothetical protein ACE5GY_06290 [Thermodesulfobacteriota bacterium]